MWVVKAAQVLEMTGRFRPHQILKAEGLLAKWSANKFTMFVSHQWLGCHHPDPDGTQLEELQGFLRNLFAKKIKIEADVISQFNGSSPTEAELSQIEGGFIWLDYFCVPQVMDGHGPNGLAKQQSLYIQSIPNYVDSCNLFVALVPNAMHSDAGSQCNMHTWLTRGWCRTELWCHVLSTRSTPIIVVKSREVAEFRAPLWHRYPVQSGIFALDNDCQSCCLGLLR